MAFTIQCGDKLPECKTFPLLELDFSYIFIEFSLNCIYYINYNLFWKYFHECFRCKQAKGSKYSQGEPLMRSIVLVFPRNVCTKGKFSNASIFHQNSRNVSGWIVESRPEFHQLILHNEASNFQSFCWGWRIIEFDGFLHHWKKHERQFDTIIIWGVFDASRKKW